MKENHPNTRAKVDCPKFKPIPTNEKYCRLTNRCLDAGIKYIQEGYFYYGRLLNKSRCTGIRRKEDKC